MTTTTKAAAAAIAAAMGAAAVVVEATQASNGSNNCVKAFGPAGEAKWQAAAVVALTSVQVAESCPDLRRFHEAWHLDERGILLEVSTHNSSFAYVLKFASNAQTTQLCGKVSAPRSM